MLLASKDLKTEHSVSPTPDDEADPNADNDQALGFTSCAK
jgi:hypothetical protein